MEINDWLDYNLTEYFINNKHILMQRKYNILRFKQF